MAKLVLPEESSDKKVTFNQSDNYWEQESSPSFYQENIKKLNTPVKKSHFSNY
jgi:hypothetical protein